MANIVQSDGRRLIIEFTCQRCGIIEYGDYIDCTNYSPSSNMRCSPVPEGWTDAVPGKPLLCKECSEQYNKFMRNERIY